MTRSPKAPATSTPEGDRIAKVLSRAGVASRREAERMIAAGEVAVNGKTIDSPALNVSSKDRITVNGKPLAAPEPARLWRYYKPEGLVTSAADEKGRDTVFDHLPEDMPRVMSVGRLDLNSEGLLLLTNDGELKRRLELPSTGWLRKYRVRVKGNPTDPDLEPLRKGITVEGETFQPMQVVMDRHQGANAWLTVGLREGKNREIRRAMAAIGLTVNRLIRISYGPFRLNELQPGEVEEVRPRVLRDQLGLTEAAEDAPAPKRGSDKRPAGKAGPDKRPTDKRPAGPTSDRKAAARGDRPAAKASPDRPARSAAPRSETAKPATRPTGSKPAPSKPAARGEAASRSFSTQKPATRGETPAKPRSPSTSKPASPKPATRGEAPAKPRSFSTAKPAAPGKPSRNTPRPPPKPGPRRG